MRKNPSFSRELIPLKEASKISGYHPDYLSYLIRKGKIEGKRIGRDWFTTEKAIRTYLSTKKFLPIRELLFSKIKPRTIFVFALALILIGIGAFLILNPPDYFQRAKGDFNAGTEFQTKNLNIQPSNGKEIKEVKVTTYSSDSAGGIEISIQPESASLPQDQEPLLFQKLKDFFRKLFK